MRSWIHRFYRFREFMTHIAPTSASMGYGMPAAIAMQRLHPERLVLSVNGDGDFLMSGQEFAIAVQYRLPIIVLVCDNGMYGTIRMHQEREFPGPRVCATELHNPDFDAYARAFGGFGVREQDIGFSGSLRRRRGHRPALHHSSQDRPGRKSTGAKTVWYPGAGYRKDGREASCIAMREQIPNRVSAPWYDKGHAVIGVHQSGSLALDEATIADMP